MTIEPEKNMEPAKEQSLKQSPARPKVNPFGAQLLYHAPNLTGHGSSGPLGFFSLQASGGGGYVP